MDSPSSGGGGGFGSSPKEAPKSSSLMDSLLGLLRIRVKRGVNLAVRDVRSSDPYVVIKMAKQTWLNNLKVMGSSHGAITLCIMPKLVPILMIINSIHDMIIDLTSMVGTHNFSFSGEASIYWLPSRDKAEGSPKLTAYKLDDKWSQHNGKLKTRVIKKDVNPQWNEDLTLSISDPDLPIKLTVYDHDTFSKDDKMGDAEFHIKGFVEAMRMDLHGLPAGTVVTREQPSRQNCLAEESCITWTDGKISQDLCLRLRNVECGEVELSLHWIDLPGSKGL
ncbi:hypothetical protein TEA_022503 [Camellia sinensis var. sinensis]|uniref:C2 domain-containing protein n=1 Tax=Camellia sinensis var. sinensis TaxID=542762 RepID=A0A4S4EQR0_CAMSN|nr:hypothetical protein TEA_022503 [Camellia sinensis var. sinensis]